MSPETHDVICVFTFHVYLYFTFKVVAFKEENRDVYPRQQFPKDEQVVNPPHSDDNLQGWWVTVHDPEIKKPKPHVSKSSLTGAKSKETYVNGERNTLTKTMNDEI